MEKIYRYSYIDKTSQKIQYLGVVNNDVGKFLFESRKFKNIHWY